LTKSTDPGTPAPNLAVPLGSSKQRHAAAAPEHKPAGQQRSIVDCKRPNRPRPSSVPRDRNGHSLPPPSPKQKANARKETALLPSG
uniref:Uncharacterized protein n=2 Tax=Ixodes scapularis TaxID=6945 RepID=A0A1S4KY20_IXOSC